MATVAQLEAALRKADAAGDADGARIIARALKESRSTATAGETAIDMARVIPGGLAKGVSYVLDQTSPTYLVNQAIGTAENLTGQTLPRMPTPSQHTEALVNQATGGYYKSQTAGGRYVERIAEMAPAAATPGGAVARIARMALPGLGSAGGEDIAGEIDPQLAPYGSAIGALAGGVATLPRVTRSISQVALGVPRAERILTSTAARSIGGAAGVRQRAAEFEATGEPYSFIDVGGHGTQRVMRASAAGEGPAQDIANRYHSTRMAETPDRAFAATDRLVRGDLRTAQQATDDFKAARGRAADVDYAPAYEQSVTLDEQILTALSGTHGRTAIRRALSAADARLDTKQADELRALLSDTPPQQVSAGTLHRIQIGMGERAKTAMRGGARDIGSGLYGRTDTVRDTLEQVPSLGPANAAYRAGSADIDAVTLGTKGLTMSEPNYASQIANFAAVSPNARSAAGLGMREAMTNAIGSQPAGTTGTLNRLANAPKIQANTEATFGADAAKLYQTQINQIMTRLKNAAQNTPGAGSRTAILESDMKSLPSIPHSSLGALVALGNWIRTKGVVTDAVRAEIQRLGTSEAEVRRLIANIPTNVSTAQYIATVAAASQGNRRTP